VRDDAAQLPGFQQQWQTVLNYANQASDEAWQVAKALLMVLRLSLLQSADLTSGQAEDLASRYQAQMVAVHNQAVKSSMLDDAEQVPLTHSLAAMLAL
jgi:hypothetical protein